MVRVGVCLGLLVFGSAVSFGQWTVQILDTPGYEQCSYSAINGTRAAGYAAEPISNYRAMMWNADGTLISSLHPTGYDSSLISGMSGSAQVGWGSAVPDEPVHALLWHDTAASVIDLNPANWETTLAYGASDHGQVGYGTSSTFTNGSRHALYWNSSAESVVDLNPSGFYWSEALGIGDGFQVGYAYNSSTRPYLWRDSAASGIDLGVSGYGGGRALAASATKQVGYLNWNNNDHAALWSGTAASFVDLNPIGYGGSEARAISWSGEYQVGSASLSTGLRTQAMLWSGTAESAINLESYLSDLPYTIGRSVALGVSDNGDVVGVFQEPNSSVHFVRWTHVVPEPGLGTVVFVGLGLLFRRRKA